MRGVFVNSQGHVGSWQGCLHSERCTGQGSGVRKPLEGVRVPHQPTIELSISACDWCESDLTLIPSTASIHLPNSVFIGVLSSTYHVFHALILYSCWQKGQQDCKLGAGVSMHNGKGSLSKVKTAHCPITAPACPTDPFWRRRTKNMVHIKKKN